MKKSIKFFVFVIVFFGTSFSPQVTSPTSGYINGYRYVDLGLSVKWATCNIGAQYPAERGEYFAWGETKSKSSCTWDNSVTYMKDIGNIAGNSQYDAARANWGGTWRLPTDKEIDELISKCKFQWTAQGTIWGYKIVGPNGRSIFLPATGEQSEVGICIDGESGRYWSATPKEDNDMCAYVICFRSDHFEKDWFGRDYGLPIRPVSK